MAKSVCPGRTPGQIRCTENQHERPFQFKSNNNNGGEQRMGERVVPGASQRTCWLSSHVKQVFKFRTCRKGGWSLLPSREGHAQREGIGRGQPTVTSGKGGNRGLGRLGTGQSVGWVECRETELERREVDKLGRNLSDAKNRDSVPRAASSQQEAAAAATVCIWF